MPNRVRYNDATLSSLNWAGDVRNADSLLRGSAHVNEKKWTADATTGRIAIPSGTLLGRRNDDAFLFEPVPANTKTDLGTTLAVDIAAGATVLKLATVSGYEDGDGITIDDGTNSETATIAADGVDRDESTIKLTSGTTNAFAAATPTTVSLTSAAAMTDFYLLAFDVIDASENNEIPALYRHNRLVRINLLPDYASLDANVINQIKALYQTIKASTV